MGREAVREILETLTPCELVVALLRAEGMSDGEIGEFLGIERGTVRRRMVRARARIARTVPGMARLVEGRRRGVELCSMKDDAGEEIV